MFSGKPLNIVGQFPVGTLLASSFAVACCLGIPPLAEAADATQLKNWHQWRGPDANGVSRTANPPVEWSEKKNIRWKVPIERGGSSTPIIWEKRVFVLAAVNTGIVDSLLPKPEDQPKRVFGITHPNTEYKFVVLCLDRDTGKELWRQTATQRVPHEGHHGDNNFASGSPTTDGQRLYCWFGSAGLFCYDLGGKFLWKRDLGKADVGSSLGEGCSPVVHGGKIVIVRDHRRQSTIEVLDSKTGKTLWKANREEGNAWATPIVVKRGGRTQVITAASKLVRSYDLENGTILWQCSGLTGNVTPCPIVDGDVVFCMSGYKGCAVMALPLSARGDISGTDQVIWSCLDSKTGKAVMRRTRLPGLSNIYSSPVGAAGRIYVTGRNGTTLVLKRSRQLNVLATNRLDERIDASPALAGTKLFLRGSQSLYCIEDNSIPTASTSLYRGKRP